MIDSEGLRSAAGMSFNDPYGVPTGVVLRPTARDDAINKCIDGYLLTERKARAWDALQATATAEGWAKVLAAMDSFLP